MEKNDTRHEENSITQTSQLRTLRAVRTILFRVATQVPREVTESNPQAALGRIPIEVRF